MVHVLVHGFGPFLDVLDNPSARLARAVHGWSGSGVRVTGEAMPVSYARAPALSIARARALGVDAVVGIGVARARDAVNVERVGRNRLGSASADVDGVCQAQVDPAGPDVHPATLDPVALARALGGVVSDDAGRYVCNAWLYAVAGALGPEMPVAFVHVPPAGLEPARLVGALVATLASPGATS